MRRVLIVVPLIALAGCSSSSSNTTPEAVFQGACGSCHTLKAAGTHGNVGPNLDDLKPSVATVEHQIEHGGGGMPAGLLTGSKRQQVAAYVANATGGR